MIAVDFYATFADRVRRRELFEWGAARGFELREASMERLTMLFYRFADFCVLRFVAAGAVLRRTSARHGMSLAHLERFAYVYEASVAMAVAALADPTPATHATLTSATAGDVVRQTSVMTVLQTFPAAYCTSWRHTLFGESVFDTCWPRLQ